jgi:glucosamine--fructose-6-phosphate aminotransferase (isomerizing)
LRSWLSERGVSFRSQTDTEVVPHLIAAYYQGDLEQAFSQAISRLRGAFALAVVSALHPDVIYAYRKDSPLVVGLGDGENFLASDIPALLPYTREVYLLEDGEMAVLTRDGVTVKVDGHPIEKSVYHVTWDAVAAEKGGYDHFMLKEIFEQPKALRDTFTGRLGTDPGQEVSLPELGLTKESLQHINRLYIVACGTSYHAGMIGKYAIERLARLQVEVDLASEFRYRDPLLDDQTVVLVISQSGETADTLAALREAKRQGCPVWAITNVVGSSVAREADAVMATWAGPEIAVASTKAYTTQLVTLLLLAIHLAELRQSAEPQELQAVAQGLRALPEQLQQALADVSTIKELAEEIANHDDVFFIGRGLDYAVALEAALKLKEISYIHAEALAAGELKHGTLALITDGTPVVCLLTQPAFQGKMVSNIEEVLARDAFTLVVDTAIGSEVKRLAHRRLALPAVHPMVAPILSIVPLQLLAYYAALARRCDVDKPRNLAKSVTIE